MSGTACTTPRPRPTSQAIVSPLATTGTSSIVAVVSAVASGSSRSITCWVPSHATPRVPNRLAHACPTSGMTTASTGRTPIDTRSGATTAIGAPKPVMPCRNEANTHPNPMIRNRRLRLNAARPWRMAACAPARSVTRYSSNAGHTTARMNTPSHTPLPLATAIVSIGEPNAVSATITAIASPTGAACAAVHRRTTSSTTSTTSGATASDQCHTSTGTVTSSRSSGTAQYPAAEPSPRGSAAPSRKS